MLTRSAVWTISMRPSPTEYDTRRFTRYTPPLTSTHGRMCWTHRLVMPCICGGVFVVVDRLRAAAVPRLVNLSPFSACGCASAAKSTDIDSPKGGESTDDCPVDEVTTGN